MNRDQFQRLMLEHETSGLSARAFCQSKNLSYSKYLYARRVTLEREEITSNQVQSDFIEIVSKDSEKGSLASLSHAVVNIGEATLSIPMTATEHEWLKVFRALQNVSQC
jgi:hypothetical protein